VDITLLLAEGGRERVCGVKMDELCVPIALLVLIDLLLGVRLRGGSCSCSALRLRGRELTEEASEATLDVSDLALIAPLGGMQVVVVKDKRGETPPLKLPCLGAIRLE